MLGGKGFMEFGKECRGERLRVGGGIYYDGLCDGDERHNT